MIGWCQFCPAAYERGFNQCCGSRGTTGLLVGRPTTQNNLADSLLATVKIFDPDFAVGGARQAYTNPAQLLTINPQNVPRINRILLEKVLSAVVQTVNFEEEYNAWMSRINQAVSKASESGSSIPGIDELESAYVISYWKDLATGMVDSAQITLHQLDVNLVGAEGSKSSFYDGIVNTTLRAQLLGADSLTTKNILSGWQRLVVSDLQAQVNTNWQGRGSAQLQSDVFDYLATKMSDVMDMPTLNKVSQLLGITEAQLGAYQVADLFPARFGGDATQRVAIKVTDQVVLDVFEQVRPAQLRGQDDIDLVSLDLSIASSATSQSTSHDSRVVLDTGGADALDPLRGVALDDVNPRGYLAKLKPESVLDDARQRFQPSPDLAESQSLLQVLIEQYESGRFGNTDLDIRAAVYEVLAGRVGSRTQNGELRLAVVLGEVNPDDVAYLTAAFKSVMDIMTVHDYSQVDGHVASGISLSNSDASLSSSGGSKSQTTYSSADLVGTLRRMRTHRKNLNALDVVREESGDSVVVQTSMSRRSADSVDGGSPSGNRPSRVIAAAGTTTSLDIVAQDLPPISLVKVMVMAEGLTA